MGLFNADAVERHMRRNRLLPCRFCGSEDVRVSPEPVAVVPYFLVKWPGETLEREVDPIASIGDCLIQITCLGCRIAFFLEVEDWPEGPDDIYDEDGSFDPDLREI